MNKVLQKKSIQFSLALLVFLIWGYNMFKIVDISNESGSKTKNKKITFDNAFFTMPEAREYQYKADFEDPFQPQLHRKRRQEKNPQKISKSQPVKIPNLKLSGIIEGTALIQNSDQTIFFATVGDTVEKARVLSISPDSVVMKKESKKFTITLQ